MKTIRIDYGNNITRKFNRRAIRNVRRHLKMKSITRSQLREATREWAESMPDMSKELSFAR